MATSASIQNAWKSSSPGGILVADSDVGRLTLARTSRAKGSPQVTLDFTGRTISREPEVGSSDTLLLRSGLRDLHVKGGTWLASSRAGIKTEGPGGARDVWLEGMRVTGLWDAVENNAKDILPVKWLAHHYYTGSWIESNMRYDGCSDEHARYLHNILGNHYFFGTYVNWCGRTALQVVGRKQENGVDQPVPHGDITLDSEYVEDVCLEQNGGGSAYSFDGGMPDSVITMKKITGRLGCNADLNPALRGRATGMLMMRSGPASSPGSGDEAYPGGTKELRCTDNDFEVGTVYPGQGSAKRPCVRVGACGLFTWTDGRIVVPKGEVALEIFASCNTFLWSGSPEVVGKVNYKGEAFDDWDEFVNAHPECKV